MRHKISSHLSFVLLSAQAQAIGFAHAQLLGWEASWCSVDRWKSLKKCLCYWRFWLIFHYSMTSTLNNSNISTYSWFYVVCRVWCWLILHLPISWMRVSWTRLQKILFWILRRCCCCWLQAVRAESSSVKLNKLAENVWDKQNRWEMGLALQGDHDSSPSSMLISGVLVFLVLYIIKRCKKVKGEKADMVGDIRYMSHRDDISKQSWSTNQ